MKTQLFRVWDKENNKYFEPTFEAYNGNIEDITLTSHGEIILRTFDKPAIHESVFPDRFESPQFFTGKYDSLNKPIYFGDLIKFEDIDDPYEVIINDFMQIPVVDNDLGQMGLHKCHNVITVVGNIYEGVNN